MILYKNNRNHLFYDYILRTGNVKKVIDFSVIYIIYKNSHTDIIRQLENKLRVWL